MAYCGQRSAFALAIRNPPRTVQSKPPRIQFKIREVDCAPRDTSNVSRARAVIWTSGLSRLDAQASPRARMLRQGQCHRPRLQNASFCNATAGTSGNAALQQGKLAETSSGCRMLRKSGFGTSPALKHPKMTNDSKGKVPCQSLPMPCLSFGLPHPLQRLILHAWVAKRGMRTGSALKALSHDPESDRPCCIYMQLHMSLGQHKARQRSKQVLPKKLGSLHQCCANIKHCPT